MKWISRKEELLLLTVWRLKDNAYGVTIRDHLLESTQKYWSIGAIYDVLDRLTQKGFLTSIVGEPLPERGGRSKKYYRITKSGFEALKDVREITNIMWSGLSGMALDYE